MKNDSFIFLWDRLATILRKYCDHYEVVTDEPGDLRVKTHKGRPFVTIRIQKSHVGIYLLPMFYHPDIVPALLKNNKHGGGTLRFTDMDDLAIEQLPALFDSCLAVIDSY